MSSPPFELEIKKVKTEHREDILQLLRNNFFKDEPCNEYLGAVSDEKPINEDMESYDMDGFDNGLGLLAVHNRKLVGVALNNIVEKGEKKGRTMECRDENFSKVVEFLKYVNKYMNIFEKYPDCDKAINLRILSADKSFRRKGIAKALVEKTREIGTETGCGFIYVRCTSHFSASALKGLGFELVYSLDYADYKVNGEVIFKPAPPHRTFTVYSKKLD